MKIQEVYYVDDDKDDLAIFRETINSLRLKAQLFNDGYKLLIKLESAEPAHTILFVDLNMPKMDGFEVIRTIRKQKKFDTLPIIAFSTAKNQKTIELCKEAGANLHLPKPTNLAAYQKTIIDVLAINWEEEMSA